MSPILPEFGLVPKDEYTYLEHVLKRSVPDELKINDTQKYVLHMRALDPLSGPVLEDTELTRRRVTLIVAACYIVAIGIRELQSKLTRNDYS